MVQPGAEARFGAFRLDFDRRLKLEFHGSSVGSSVTSDAGLLAYRELDDAPGPMTIAEQHLVDRRTGRNGRHDIVDVLRQSVFGRLAGHEDVNDADRRGRDPAIRHRPARWGGSRPSGWRVTETSPCSQVYPGNVHSEDGWKDVLGPVVGRYRERDLRRTFRADAAFASPGVSESLEVEGCKYTIRLPAQASCWSPAEHGPALLRLLQLSGGELDQVDVAVMLLVRRQCGASPVACDGS